MCIDPRVQKPQNQKLQGLRTGKGECPSLRKERRKPRFLTLLFWPSVDWAMPTLVRIDVLTQFTEASTNLF